MVTCFFSLNCTRVMALDLCQNFVSTQYLVTFILLDYSWYQNLVLAYGLFPGQNYPPTKTESVQANWSRPYLFFQYLIFFLVGQTLWLTGPRSPDGIVSDCRSMGHKFDPGSVPYFRGDWSWNNFYGHSLPFYWFKKSCCQLQAKVWLLSQACPGKFWLGELTVPTWP